VDALPALAGSHAADDGGAGPEHAPGVLGALGTRHPLHDDPRVLGEPDRHCQTPAAASAAARRAAPSIGSTRPPSGLPAVSRMRRPSSALLPSSRTTSGFVTASPRLASSSNAARMPLATASQAVMPPKTLTKTLRTDGSESTISRPL